MRIEFIPPEASGSVSLVETGNISRYLNNPDMGHGYSYSVDGRGYILSGVPASGYKIDWGYGIRFEKRIVRKKWYFDGSLWSESEFTSIGYLLSEDQNEKSIIDGLSDEEFYLEWPNISDSRSFYGKTTEYYPQDEGGGIYLEDTVEIVSAVVRFIKTDDITIDVSASPSDGGDVSGGGTYAKGAAVTVTATARQGYKFSRWETPDGTIVSTQASYSFTASENRTLVAKFVEDKPYIVYYHIPEGFPKSLVDVLVFKTSDSWHTKIIEQVGVKDAEEPNIKYAEFNKLDHNTEYDFVCRIDAASWDESIDRYSVCAAVTSSKVNCSRIQFLGYYSLVRAIHTGGALVEQNGSLDVYLCVTPYVYLSKRLSELIESDKIGYESLAYDSVNVNYGRTETDRFEILPRSFSPYPTSGAHGADGSAIGDNDCITCGWLKLHISSEAIDYFKKAKIAIAFYFPMDCILNRESTSKFISKRYDATELTFAFMQKYRDFDTSEIPVEVDADIQDGNPWLVIDIAESGLLYGSDHNLLIYDPQTNSLVFYDATK